ncbi:MAG: YkgJ family cysteine cluster protein [Gammaproteobacteria bacterium]|nr:YkgJ family cysteine cluster protein [Gammaproteobacteria bacterium]
MRLFECVDGASSDMALEAAIVAAERNRERLLAEIPRGLLEREERLINTFERHKGNAVNKLRALYGVMDELYAVAKRFTPCGRGCASCCHYAVELTALEIELIVRETGRKPLKVFGASRDFHGEPCPFLRDARCAIYDSRPYVCRRHFMFAPSSNWCVPELSMTRDFPLLSFTEIEKVLSKIVTL